MADRNYSVVIAGVLGNQSVANVLNFNIPEGDLDPVESAQALIDALDGDFMDKYCDCLPVAYHATSMKCKRTSVPGGPVVVKIYGSTDHEGTRTGEVSTTACGPVILSQGPTAFKFLTAKIFLPGVSETDIAVNTFTAPLLAVLATFISVINTAIPMAAPYSDANYQIYNRATKTAISATNWKVSLKPGVQRRRMVPIA